MEIESDSTVVLLYCVVVVVGVVVEPLSRLISLHPKLINKLINVITDSALIAKNELRQITQNNVNRVFFN